MIIAIPANNADSTKEVPKRAQNAAYAVYTKNAGFSPVIVPMETDAEDVVNFADGLLLPGGIDISPIHYGLDNWASYAVDPDKDAHERGLLAAFIGAGKPVFGICRGFQLIMREYMAETGNMDGLLSYEEHVQHHAQTSGLSMLRRHPSHRVVTTVGGLLTEFDGPNPNEPTRYNVNSMHHQAVLVNPILMAHPEFEHLNQGERGQILANFNYRIPPVRTYENFEMVAWTSRGVKCSQPKTKDFDPEDYYLMVEACKIDWAQSKVMGVQWHPEEMQDVRIMRNFFLNALAGNDQAVMPAGMGIV